MVGLGFLFVLLALIAVILAWTKKLSQNRWFLWIMSVAIILPYLACELGWIVAEIGRQPWIVYGLLRTAGRGLAEPHARATCWGPSSRSSSIYVALAVVDASSS